MQRAVVSFRQGYQSAAFAGAQAAINLIVFGYESVLDTDLKDKDIDPDAWKGLAVDCLLSANKETIAGSIFEWQSKVGRLLECKIAAFGLPRSLTVPTGTIKPKKIGEWDKDCATYIPQSGADMYTVADVPVTTVHGVKGETHDVTIFVCPPTSPRHCPSVIWWSEDSNDREERRIAYVAMTRTQRDLIVCVHDTTYQRLITDHKEFVDTFESMTATMYLAARACSDH